MVYKFVRGAARASERTKSPRNLRINLVILARRTTSGFVEGKRGASVCRVNRALFRTVRLVLLVDVFFRE